MNKRGGAAATQSIHRSRIRPVANKISAEHSKEEKKKTHSKSSRAASRHSMPKVDSHRRSTSYRHFPLGKCTRRATDTCTAPLLVSLRSLSKKKKKEGNIIEKNNQTYDDGRKPKDTTGTHSHQRRKGSVNQSNGSDEQQVDND